MKAHPLGPTTTSVAGGEMGSKEAETYEFDAADSHVPEHLWVLFLSTLQKANLSPTLAWY